VLEHPVERIIAAFPYWRRPGTPTTEAENDQQQVITVEFSFFFAGNTDHSETLLEQALTDLETAAVDTGATHLRYQAALPSNHPRYTMLTEKGYTIAQTDRHFTIVPADGGKARVKRIHDRHKSRIPGTWRIESIRGHSAEEIYAFVAPHSLMPPQQFKQYWDSSNKEHFEEQYSCILLEDQEIIGAFLVTQRGKKELHIHIEASHPDWAHKSHLIALCLTNHSLTNCPPGFPEKFTFRADSENHQQTGNTAIRNKGTEDPPRYYLAKPLLLQLC
jgi:hypothetical protein